MSSNDWVWFVIWCVFWTCSITHKLVDIRDELRGIKRELKRANEEKHV